MVAESVWDPVLGLPTLQKDPYGTALRTSYDAFGRPLSVTQLSTSGATSRAETHFSYGRHAGLFRITRETLGHGRVVAYLNRVGQLVRQTSSAALDGTVDQHFRYDLEGRLVRASLPSSSGPPLGGTLYRYDPLGRTILEAIVDAEVGLDEEPEESQLRRTTTVFDRLSMTQTDAEGRWTRSESNALGQIVRSTDGTGTQTCFLYGAFGRLAEMRRGCVDAEDHKEVYEHDGYGRLRDLLAPGGLGHRRYGYDGLGRLRWSQDGKENNTLLDYDALGRLRQRRDADGTAQWLYDEVDAANGVPGRSAPGRLLRTVGPTGIVRDLSYDIYGGFQESCRMESITQHGIRSAYDSPSLVLGLGERWHVASSGAWSRSTARDGASSRRHRPAHDG